MKKLLLLTLAFTLFACSGGDDLNNSATNSVFQGEWSGTFSGDDNGTWTGTVDENGNIIGVAISTTFNDTYTASGTFSSDGNVSITVGSVDTGALFEGQATSNTVTGTWVNSGAMMNGIWSGSKD